MAKLPFKHRIYVSWDPEVLLERFLKTSSFLVCVVSVSLAQGVGTFTIVDDAVVTGADVGSNFFLLPEHIGEPRAKASCELLEELTGQVKGKWVGKVLSQNVV